MSKKQWKNVTDNVSLQFATRSAWSQEEVDAPTVDVNVIRSILPTKTSATRQITDLESITANGPFLLNFANIPYEATELDLKNFFRTSEVANVIKNDQRRGTGIIEFRDFNSLTSALNMNEKVLINRPIRLTVGNKDDLARLQSSGTNQRNRFQNQQRPQQSTMSDDSENWRVRKSQQPASQPPMESASSSKEKTNWREKPTARISDEKPSQVDTSENWRRPKSVETKAAAAAPTTTTTTAPAPKSSNFYRPHVSEQRENLPRPIATPSPLTTGPTHRSESSRDSDSAKKASIFGEAKPVDTTAKDLEIELKIQSNRDVSGTAAPKASAWGNKKSQSSTNVPLAASSPTAATTSSPSDTKSSSIMEWREQRVPPAASGTAGAVSQRSKTHSDSQRDAKQDHQQQQQDVAPVKPAEPVPAPIPQKNIWTERMKSKVTVAPATSQQQQPQQQMRQQTPQPDRSSGTIGQKPTMTADKPSIDIASTGNVEQVAATGATSTASSPAVSQSEKVMPTATHQKPPVVISANGPFFDPKSHHSSSASATAGSYGRAPTAVPLAAMTTGSSSSSSTIASKVTSCPIDKDGGNLPLYHPQQQQQPQQQPQPIAKPALSSQAAGLDGKGALPSAVKSCGTQSSWAKGPPKGLIEKAEMNQ